MVARVAASVIRAWTEPLLDFFGIDFGLAQGLQCRSDNLSSDFLHRMHYGHNSDSETASEDDYSSMDSGAGSEVTVNAAEERNKVEVYELDKGASVSQTAIAAATQQFLDGPALSHCPTEIQSGMESAINGHTTRHSLGGRDRKPRYSELTSQAKSSHDSRAKCCRS